MQLFFISRRHTFKNRLLSRTGALQPPRPNLRRLDTHTPHITGMQLDCRITWPVVATWFTLITVGVLVRSCVWVYVCVLVRSCVWVLLCVRVDGKKTAPAGTHFSHALFRTIQMQSRRQIRGIYSVQCVLCVSLCVCCVCLSVFAL